MQEMLVWSQAGKILLEKGMTTPSSVLAWRILWTEESMGLQRLGHDWAHTHVYLSRYTLYTCVLQTLRPYSNISHFQAYLKCSLSSASPMVSFFCFGLCWVSTVLFPQILDCSPGTDELCRGGRKRLSWLHPRTQWECQPTRDHSVCEDVLHWQATGRIASEGSPTCGFMISSTYQLPVVCVMFT